jgi:hypothetical protein
MINISKVHELLYKLNLEGKSLMVSYDRLKSNNIKVRKNWLKQGTHLYGVKPHFQQYFIHIVAVSFIGGGNRSKRRKPHIT